MNEQQEREAFEAWYETDACFGIEPTWAAWQARAALAAKAPEPVYQLSPTDIYDFAGWLTTRKESMQVGSSHEASQMAEAVGEYLKTYPERFAPDAAKVPADALATAIACLDRFARTNEDMDALAALRELTATPAPAPEADPCLVLWKAMNQAGKVGNRTDDKLIVKFLRDAGYRIAPAPAPEAVKRYAICHETEQICSACPTRSVACEAATPAQAQQAAEADEELCRQAMQRWREAKPEAQQADEIGPSAIFEMADKYWYRRGGVSNFDTVGFAKELLRMRGIGASGEAT